MNFFKYFLVISDGLSDAPSCQIIDWKRCPCTLILEMIIFFGMQRLPLTHGMHPCMESKITSTFVDIAPVPTKDSAVLGGQQSFCRLEGTTGTGQEKILGEMAVQLGALLPQTRLLSNNPTRCALRNIPLPVAVGPITG
jgi:hypothetical protein